MCSRISGCPMFPNTPSSITSFQGFCAFFPPHSCHQALKIFWSRFTARDPLLDHIFLESFFLHSWSVFYFPKKIVLWELSFLITCPFFPYCYLIMVFVVYFTYIYPVDEDISVRNCWQDWLETLPDLPNRYPQFKVDSRSKRQWSVTFLGASLLSLVEQKASRAREGMGSPACPHPVGCFA